MQVRAILLLIVAVLLGAATVYLVNDYLQKEVGNREAVETQELTQVVVVTANLIPGTRLTSEMLKLADYEPESAPEGHFTRVVDVISPNPETAPILLREARAGEPVLKYMLSSYGARGGLPTKIPEDMRAVTIETSEIKGVGGFVLPGDYVDVLHTTSSGRTDKRLVNRMILQNAQVLGVDQLNSPIDAEPTIVNAITLLVSPFDGQRLTLAQKLGELTLLLRNEFDASIIEDSIATYKELLNNGQENTVVVSKRVRRPRIEIIRGLEVTKKTVEEAKTEPKKTTP